MSGYLVTVLLVVLPFVCRAADLSDGLVMHLPFNGTMLDESGNAHHGTAYGGIVYVDGVRWQAALFDGENDYINVPHHDDIDFVEGESFSVSVWFKTDDQSSFWDKYLLCKRIDPYTGYGVAISPSLGERIAIGGEDTVSHNAGVASTNPVIDGTWHHIVGIRHYGEKWVLYIDGQLDNIEPDPLLGLHNTVDLVIGVYDSIFTPGQIRYYSGLLDELRIYKRALSEDEAKALYREGSCSYGPDAPFVVEREPGRPSSKLIIWESCGGPGEIIIHNNQARAQLWLNDETILIPGCFKEASRIGFRIELLEGENQLEVLLSGQPGTGISVEFIQNPE